MAQAAYNDGFADGYARGFFDGQKGLFRPPGGRQHDPVIATLKSPARKRRKTAYQSAYSAAYKRLKKKHPRTSFGSLSKKAHAAARRKVGKRR